MRPNEFVSGSVPNIVSFGFDNIGPPSPLYIQRDDRLAMQAVSSLTNEVVTFNARLLLPRGPMAGQPESGPPDAATLAAAKLGFIQPLSDVITFGNVIGAATITLLRDLSEGYLLSVTASNKFSNQRGQTYARAWINRGPVGTNPSNSFLPLFCDYPVAFGQVGWPGGRLQAGVEGPGMLNAQLIANLCLARYGCA
jgi:hypothetical protein